MTSALEASPYDYDPRLALYNLSPVDGRDAAATAVLRPILSEAAQYRYRAWVELEWMLYLARATDINNYLEWAGAKNLLTVSDEQVERMRDVFADFDPAIPYEYDNLGRNGYKATHHDVKALELSLKELFAAHDLSHLNEYIHFPLTSEDVSNIAWSLMLRDALNVAFLPAAEKLCDSLADAAEAEAYTPVLGRTHGRPASPTTVGKQFSVPLNRMRKALQAVAEHKFEVKLSGPVGNHNAMYGIMPGFDMRFWAGKFAEDLGFVYAEAENQRTSGDNTVELLNDIQRYHLALEELSNNIWQGIEDDRFDLKPKGVGSSVMPQKINPWRLEKAIGASEFLGGLIDSARRGLSVTSYERDMTDHYYQRNFGTMFGTSLVAIKSFTDDFSRLEVKRDNCLEELRAHPEVVAEAVNIGGRMLGVDDAYMKVKSMTQGRGDAAGAMAEFIAGLPESEIKETLANLKPEDYLGSSGVLACEAVRSYRLSRKNGYASGCTADAVPAGNYIPLPRPDARRSRASG